MILQRDRRLNKKIQKYGCYFMSLLFLANKFKNYPLSAQKIEELYDFFVLEHWMDKECFIKKPKEIMNFLGMKVKKVIKSTDLIEGAPYEVLHFEREKPSGGFVRHFTAGDGFCNVTYDPWGKSRTATEGTLISRRLFIE